MNGISAPQAPSTTSTTPLNAPRLRGTRNTPAMLSPFAAERTCAKCPALLLRYPAKARNHGRVFTPDCEGSAIGGSDGSGRNNPHETRRPYRTIDGLLGLWPSVPS